MALTLNTCLQPSRDTIATEIPGAHGQPEAVLLNIATHQYFNLNASGVQIWKVIERQQPLSTAVEDLLVSFDVERERADAAVLRLAEELSAAALVTEVQENT